MALSKIHRFITLENKSLTKLIIKMYVIEYIYYEYNQDNNLPLCDGIFVCY